MRRRLSRLFSQPAREGLIRQRFASILIGLAFLAAPVAHAQALPDALRNAGVTVAEWTAVQDEVKRAAAQRGASEKALAAIAQRIGASFLAGGKVDVEKVLAQIDASARQLVELQSRLSTLEKSGDPAIAKLLSDAQAAITAGDLAKGDRLLAEAVKSDLAGIALEQARLTERRTRAAETIGERAELARLAADYLGAAALYAQAAETAPEADLQMRWRFRLRQGVALDTRGSLFVEPAPLREAVRLYREVVLPLAPRSLRPDDWAATQNNLGVALRTLGDRGDQRAFHDAVAAYRAALEVYTRERTPADWAQTQNNLGNVLQNLGAQGDRKALQDAIAAYRAAFEVNTRSDKPMEWAQTQVNLGNAYEVVGEQQDPQALQDARLAYRAALEVFTRQRAPEAWAETQNSLGGTLFNLGINGDEQAFQDSVTAYRAALEVRTRERSPAAWAATQNNLGAALDQIGKRKEDIGALREAVAAYRAALEVHTRERAPADWARMQNNLGLVLQSLGELGDRQAARDAVTTFRAALEVRTRAVAPIDWGMTQFNLALALYTVGQTEDAIKSARAALEVFKEFGASAYADRTQAVITDLEAR